MITRSESAYALSPSNVAVKSNCLVAKYSSISLSTIGDFLLLIKSTLDAITSTAYTLLCCAKIIAFDNPTYPVPATEIFVLNLPY